MLPLLLLAVLSTTAEEPPTTLRKQIEHCPSAGYYFENDLHNPCYLCYCNHDGYAVCTIRNSEWCEDGSKVAATSEASNVGKEGKHQSRRSRRGLMDLFFDHAQKDVMVKSMAKANDEDCTPKSSKSIGCPPKDWCTGCLVCDCDENSEWQCHVMSFCEDKTPRPKAEKLKKMIINEIDTGESNSKKAKPTKKVPKKKNNKRSVKHKKYDPWTDVSPKKNARKFIKKPEASITTTTTSTTKTIPQPKIAVKTVKKFIRKSDMKNGTGVPLIVIKKYISTISPIGSPDLLKYINDSRKLAQILYQQYEATTKAARNEQPVKREIKLEKILRNKQRRHFELKYNSRGRKPMNIKEHNDWNVQKRTRTSKHDDFKQNWNKNSFYYKQNEIMNPDETKRKENIEDDEYSQEKAIEMQAGNEGSNRKPKVILIPRRRRNKRNIVTLTEVPTYSKDINNVAVNISLVSDQVEILPKVRVNENSSDLNHYKYTVYNSVTKKPDNEITNSGIVYESTIKYVDIISNDNNGLDAENATTTDTPKYTDIDKTTTQKMIYQLQALDIHNYTVTVNDISTKTYTSELKNNHSLETTIFTDYTPEPLTKKELKINETIDMETTTVVDKYQVINYADNNSSNDTHMRGPITKKVYITDIDKMFSGIKKYTLKKLRLNNRTHTRIASIFMPFNNNTVNITQNYNKSDLESLLQRLTHNSTNIHNKSKQNQLIAIKYLKKIYSQLLSPKSNRSRLNNIVVMESICDTFGPCKISTNKIEVLNSKIADLIFVTKKALDVIRTIKENLQLIDGKTNCTYSTKKLTDEVEFKNCVRKLNAVLTDTYIAPLTETQVTQMNCIKNNTKIFISSIGKFAFILNDILEIIRSEKRKYDHLRKRKILIRRFNRHKVNEPLNKIKKLFLKYNVLQNSFMRNMYRALSDLEMQNEEKVAEEDKDNNKKDARYQTSVNKYMNKINHNLEKLKALALKMGAKDRKKRNAINHDGAVEYLLTLMEYLLKHNNPAKSPPASDGIDLLIDAIRRAPDVRLIKKKVLPQTLIPKFPNMISKSVASSESEDDTFKKQSLFFNNNINFDKLYKNDTLKVKLDETYRFIRTTSETSQKSAEGTSSTSKYVDVEDLVFNGDVISKVYMATIPPYDNIDDAFNENLDIKTNTSNKTESISKESASIEDGSSVKMNEITLKTNVNTQNTTVVTSAGNPTMTKFDRLNEEYEKQIKPKPSTTNNLKLKSRKKPKRLRKKPKMDPKSDISSLTKEVKEEKIVKKVISEDANHMKQVPTSIDEDPYQMDDDSIPRDALMPLDSMGNDNDAFPNYFI